MPVNDLTAINRVIKRAKKQAQANNAIIDELLEHVERLMNELATLRYAITIDDARRRAELLRIDKDD